MQIRQSEISHTGKTKPINSKVSLAAANQKQEATQNTTGDMSHQ